MHKQLTDCWLRSAVLHSWTWALQNSWLAAPTWNQSLPALPAWFSLTQWDSSLDRSYETWLNLRWGKTPDLSLLMAEVPSWLLYYISKIFWLFFSHWNISFSMLSVCFMWRKDKTLIDLTTFQHLNNLSTSQGWLKLKTLLTFSGSGRINITALYRIQKVEIHV